MNKREIIIITFLALVLIGFVWLIFISYNPTYAPCWMIRDFAELQANTSETYKILIKCGIGG